MSAQKTSSDNLLNPGTITLLYIVAASIWILLSGYLVAHSAIDPAKANQLEAVKGIGFVVVTGLMLYLVLKSKALAVFTTDKGILYAVILLVILVLSAGFSILNAIIPQFEKTMFTDLDRTINQKIGSIKQREVEHRQALSSLSSDPAFIDNVVEFKKNNSPKARTNIEDKLKEAALIHGYENISLIDKDSDQLITFNLQGRKTGDIPDVNLSAQTINTFTQSLYLDIDIHQLRQSFIQPIQWRADAPPMFIVASLPPRQELLKPSDKTAHRYETLEFFFVSDDRSNVAQLDTSEKLTGDSPFYITSMNEHELSSFISPTPASNDSLQTKNYYLSDAIAVSRPLEGSGWLLVAKVDRSEVMGQANNLVSLLTGWVLLALTIFLTILLLLWRHQRYRHEHELLQKEVVFERQLRAQESVYKELFEANPIPMWILDSEKNTFLSVNQAAQDHYGYSLKEFLCMSESDLYVDSNRTVATEPAPIFHQKKDGTQIAVEISSRPLGFQNKDARIVLAYDVTEREVLEKNLKGSEDFAFGVIDSLSGNISVLDENGTIIATNKKWRDFSTSEGASLRDTDKGVNYLNVCERAAASTKDAVTVLDGLKKLMTGQRQHFQHEYPCHSPTEQRWFSLHLTRFNHGPQKRIVCYHENITSRKLAEENLQTINTYYAALSAMNGAIIRAVNTEQLLNDVCRIAVTHIEQLKFVCTRKLYEGTFQSSRESRGKASAYPANYSFEYDEIKLKDDEEPSVQEPCSRAVATGHPVLIKDLTDYHKAPSWATAATARGLESALIFPIIRREETWGVMMFFADKKEFFSKELVRLLKELCQDLAFSLDMLEMDKTRRENEADLRLNAKIIESTKEGVYITNSKNKITLANPSVSRITGYTTDELLGKNPRIFNSGFHPKKFFKEFWYRLVHAGYWEGEIWNRRKSGEIFPSWLSVTRVEDTTNDSFNHVAIFRDVTEKKKQESHIEHMATHDLLTDLPNRSILKERASLTIAQAERQKSIVALLFIDLDHFKLMNDTLGHEIGDQILINTGNRIASTLRDSDTISRIGGDEFVVLLNNVRSREDVASVSEKINRAIAQPLAIEHHTLLLTASIGIAMYPEHGSDISGLMRIADLAMITAKQTGKDKYHFYSGDLGSDAEEHLIILNALRSAANDGQMFLVYQPQINLRNKSLIGMEALVRWQHPDLGLVRPDQFIPLAEESGIILTLGSWIMREACRQAQQWRSQGILDVPVSVNVSALQFRHESFVEDVRSILTETGLPSNKLELEVTESLLILNIKGAIEKIKELKQLGVTIAIDDFGTGYSSMSYLRQILPNRLKIDKSFIDDLPHKKDAVAIARAIISLGGAVGTEIIAEGVETEEQADFLSSIWCSQAQGYYFARPMPATDLESWLESWPA